MRPDSSAEAIAVRAGLERGWIELRQTLTSAGEVLGWLWPSVTALFVMYALSGSLVPGTDFSLGTQAIPGILGMNIVYTGMLGLSAALTMERDDGTLLRMKAVPNGMLGYLVGKVVSQAGLTAASLLIVLSPAALLFEGLELGSPLAWLRLIGVLALGLIATLPFGALFGSMFASPQSLGFVTFGIMGVVGISGIFYPITALPVWLQWIGQVFPVYWLGLGMRWALLPDVMVAAEIEGSWRLLEMIAVLGAWTVVGFATTPAILSRMAQRTSGSGVRAPAATGQATAGASRRRT